MDDSKENDVGEGSEPERLQPWEDKDTMRWLENLGLALSGRC